VPQAVLGSTYLGHGVDFTSCCNSHDKCAPRPLCGTCCPRQTHFTLWCSRPAATVMTSALEQHCSTACHQQTRSYSGA